MEHKQIWVNCHPDPATTSSNKYKYDKSTVSLQPTCLEAQYCNISTTLTSTFAIPPSKGYFLNVNSSKHVRHISSILILNELLISYLLICDNYNNIHFITNKHGNLQKMQNYLFISKHRFKIQNYT